MTASAQPLVTVLMPVYNGERYLRQSIESILGQTFSDFEFLIIDDGSMDASREIVRSYSDPRIRLVENGKNWGLIKTLNRGLQLARGQFIARQDADDISHPTRFQSQVTFFNDHPEIVLLGTGVNIIDEHSRKRICYGYYIVSSEVAIRWQLMFDNPFVHPTVMMRTKTVRQLGGYDEHFQECEDYDLFSRIVCAHKTSNLKEILLDYRYHGVSINANRKEENHLRMGDILRRTFSHCMNVPPVEEWINFWLGINNAFAFDFTVNAKKLSEYIDAIYEKFILRYPEAQNNAEIKKHISHVYLRILYTITLKNRRASLGLLGCLFKRDISLACRFLPKYLVAFILGGHRTSIANKLRSIVFPRKRNTTEGIAYAAGKTSGAI